MSFECLSTIEKANSVQALPRTYVILRGPYMLKLLMLYFFLSLFTSCTLPKSKLLSAGDKTDGACTSCVQLDDSGLDFSGKDLQDFNFTTYKKKALQNANFEGANLSGAQFQNMDLTGAIFQDAILTPSSKGKTNFSGSTLKNTCFVNALADSCDFQFAIFQSTDFSCASLIKADFGPSLKINEGDRRTRFRKTALDIPNFPLVSLKDSTKHWGYLDFSYTQFHGLTKDNIDFQGWNMEDAILTGVNLTGFDLSLCNLRNCSFNNAILNSVIMDSAYMIGINLDSASLYFASIRNAFLYDTLYGKGEQAASLNSANLGSADMSYTIAQNASFRQANFSEAILIYTDFQNAVFSGGNSFSPANIQSVNASKANFNEANLNAVSFHYSTLDNTSFQNMSLNNTNFSNTTLSGASFYNSLLQGVNFQNATLHHVDFTETILKATDEGANVDFSCSQLGGADFTNCLVQAANFNNAVIPPDTSCCPQTGDTYNCGIDSKTGRVYGTTILPDLKENIICPNGDVAICSGEQWLVPNWTSSACNENQVQETLWIPPNCVEVDSNLIIVFQDEKLCACIADQFFNGDLSQYMTKDRAATVIDLSCEGYGISDLTGMEWFTALKQLNFSNNNLSDPEIWTYFPLLQKLTVSNNKLQQINLSGLTSLQQLNASNNEITSVIGASLLNVIDLDLSYNSLNEFPLNSLTTAYFVDLSHNLLTSVGELDENTSLSTLYLENNSLIEIGSLANCTYLQYINLSCNPGFDCESLGVDFETYCGQNDLPECQ